LKNHVGVTTVVPCPLSTKRTGESPHSLTL